MRLIVIRSTRSQTPVRVTGSASITNPGFTPVPRIATLARFAAVSMDAARRRWLYQGYASSSVLDTIGFFARRIVSICGATPFSVELVQRRTTSGRRRLERGPQIGIDLDAQLPIEADDLPEIAAGLGQIDVDGADDLEPAPHGHLPDDARANRPEPNVQDTNRHDDTP